MRNKLKETSIIGRFMRVMLVLGFLLISSGGLADDLAYAQQQKFTFSFEQVSIKSIFQYIENNSEFVFMYRNDLLDTSKKISVKAKRESIEQVLNEILSGSSVIYRIDDRQITLMRGNEIAPQQLDKQPVKGSVKDGKGEPVIGASVVEKSTTNGIITDIDGNFTLNVNPGAVLEISYIGYKTQTVNVSFSHPLSIVLQEDNEVLDEVVVIGYGTLKKKDLTGSVAGINDKAISERHATNISTALQGAVAGLTVTRGSGDPGTTGTMRLRGTTTISTSDPLVIIDGVPGDINTVSPEDVETISVLKDAASASIYGSRAAAGVILVQTKRAKKGDLKLTYNFEYAISRPTAEPKYTNAVDYMKMVNELRYNDNPSGGWNQAYTQDIIDNYTSLHLQNPDLYADTDWTNILMNHSAPRQTHIVNLMAGSEKASSKVSLRYDNMGAMYDNYQREHYMARANNDFYFNKYLEAHVDVNFRKGKIVGPNYDPYGWEGRSIPAIYPAIWSDGRYADVKDGSNSLLRMSKEAGDYHVDNNHLGFKGEIVIKPFDGFKISMVTAPNFDFSYYKTFVKKLGYTHLEDPNTIKGYINATTNLTEKRNKVQDITSQFLINYNKTFGLHDLVLMAGYEYYYYKYDNMSGSGDQYELTTYPFLDLAPKDYQAVSGNAAEYSYRSYFGRINYSYANRYLLEANIRRDGSSRFASDNRWATFPSVSLGWVLTEENFMHSTRGWLDQLKFRASWGELGNERIGSYYPYQAAIDFNTIVLMNGGTPTAATSAAQVYYAVHDITWESTSSWDIGLDAMFLKNRLNFSFDVYRKNTTDMLLAVQIPQFLGYENPSVNAGDMHTVGWDIEAGWRDHVKDFNYSVRFNLSDATSTMGGLKGTIFYNGNYISREGTEFQQFYGYKADGLFQTQEDVDNSAKINNNVKVGDIKFIDISGPDGMPDGKISAEYDRIPLKSSQPHFIYGLNFNADYKDFDASVTFQGVGSQWAIQSSYAVLGLRDNWLNFPSVIVGKYWSENNTEAQNAKAIFPRLTYSNMQTNYTSCDFWLYNNHYLRCKNITLGYTLPTALTKKFFINKLRLYVAANDLFSINNCLKGFDPESTSSGYPIMRSVMFGVNVNF
ncbi:TonB-dependent receptor [Phocaeicola oris]|uniref:TonB-dependent receptor n=1 Tax=Phocaeicola oris TaxID=2896850 RepID=UPI00234EED9C|nr:TonB-dependent receptor [Phocaeicola oris]MCE2616076.1 TonB-dependent receptor [Phocaeicola oris]